jgi:hypothetical protein
VSVWEERRCYRVPFARALPGSGGACGRNRPHALASESLPSLAPVGAPRPPAREKKGTRTGTCHHWQGARRVHPFKLKLKPPSQ